MSQGGASKKAPAEGSSSSAAAVAALRNRLLDLFGQKLSRRDFAAQMASLVAEAAQVKTLAILGYDRKRDRLVLLAEHGLPAEAQSILSGGNSRSWDIPLRGLRNRRISVIEAAHQNPFVPRPLIDISPAALTIAAIPLYYDYKPTGVVLLFQGNSHAFADNDLQALSQALKVAARGLRDSHRSADGISTEREEEIAEAAIAELTGERPAKRAARVAHLGGESTAAAHEAEQAQLTETRKLADTLLARTQRLEQDLARAHVELERSAQTARTLTSARHALARERDHLTQQLTDLERRRETDSAELRAQVAALEDRLLAAESERLRLHRSAEQARTAAQKSSKTVESEREGLLERLRGAESSAAALQAEVGRTREERERVNGQLEALHRQLQERQNELAETQARLQREVAALSADRDGWREQANAAQGLANQRAEEQRAGEHELRSALASRDATIQQLTALRAQLEQLAEAKDGLAQAATQAAAARAAAAAESASLREALDSERAERVRQEEALQGDLQQARREAIELGEGLGTLRATLADRDRLVEERDAQLARAAAESAEIQRAAATTEANAQAARQETAQLRRQLGEGEAERQRLADDRDAARRQLEQRLASRGDNERQLAEQLQSSRDQLAGLQQEHERLRRALAEAGEQMHGAEAAQREALQKLAAQAEEARGQLEGLERERTSLSQRLQHAEQTAAAETERARVEVRRAEALGDRATKLEHVLGDGEKRRAELEGALAQARSEVEALQQQTADRGAVARQAAELSGKTIELQRLLEAAREEAETLRSQLGTAEKQRAALAKGLQQAHRQHSQQSTTVEQERDRLLEMVERLKAEQQRLGGERAGQLAALEAESNSQAAALAELQATLQHAREERDRAIAERDQSASATAAALAAANEAASMAMQEGQSGAHRLAEKQRRIDELSELVRQREAALDSTQSDRRRMEETLQAAEETAAEAQRERDELRQQVQSAVEALEQERREHTDTIADLQREQAKEQRLAVERESQARQSAHFALEEKRTARYDAPLVIERSAPLERAGSSAEQRPGAATAAELEWASGEHARLPVSDVLLLDSGPLAQEARSLLEKAGAKVTVCEPGEAAVTQSAQRKISCVALNLAAGPPAWHTLKALRERVATRSIPLFTYLAAADAATGFSFTRTDFAIWPMDPGRMIERLRQMHFALRRLLVVSADVEAMGRLREPLGRAHISASMVLDGRQARDLGISLQPEAAVMHLTPGCADIARAVSSFRTSPATRELPLLILLDKPNSSHEDTFFNSVNRELLRAGGFDLSRLVTELSLLFESEKKSAA